MTDVQPASIATGTTETITGTGTVDEDVTSAHFSAVIKASGVKVASCDGDATADIECKLPLGAGKITVKAVSYPLAAGSVSILVEVTTSSLIPASLAKVTAEIRATEQNGEDVICLNVHTAQQQELESGDNTCSADKGHCGNAYQACCLTYGAQGYPCGCSLTDGTGASKGDCGTCGAAYQICCDGYKKDGFPCGCDVVGPAAGIFA